MSNASVDQLKKRFSLSLRQRSRDTEGVSEMDEESTPTQTTKFLPGRGAGDSGYNTCSNGSMDRDVAGAAASGAYSLPSKFQRLKEGGDLQGLQGKNRYSLPPDLQGSPEEVSSEYFEMMMKSGGQSLPSSGHSTPKRSYSMSMPSSPSKGLSPAMDLTRPMSRIVRRRSLSDLGFGKKETYEKLEKLGEGTYASVFLGKSSLTGLPVALKEIRLEPEEGAPCTAIREISLLKNLKHVNIVTLHDIVYSPGSLMIVFEYVKQDLKQYMDLCNGLLHMDNIRLFLFQILRGLEYCHERAVLHRDLKPQNLLIAENGELKLADFGLARAKTVPSKTYSSEVVTLWYRPPDVLLGNVKYTGSIDMWGVGCIFFEMVYGRPVFPGSSVEDELTLIFKALGTPTEQTWPGIEKNKEFAAAMFPQYSSHPLQVLAPRLSANAADILQKLLDFSPDTRLTAPKALLHPYFKCLGEEVHCLPHQIGIFSLDGIELQPDPGYVPPEPEVCDVVDEVASLELEAKYYDQ